MFYFVHILTGGVIGNFIPSLIGIILLSFISHFIFDAIPHWDGFWNKKDFRKNYGKKVVKKVIIVEIIDAIFALVCFIWLITLNNYLILIGAIFAVLPDILKIFYITPLKKNKLYLKYLSFHTKLQNDIHPIPGILLQIIIALLMIKLLF